jgi:alpha-1,3-rhamnosyl/mannosyltransferase
MASGLPGVVSDSSCLPEVSGGVWPIRSQFDPEHFATGIDTICLEPEYRKRTIEQGLEYSAQFTWERSARKTAGFFSRLQHCHRALWGLHGQELA